MREFLQALWMIVRSPRVGSQQPIMRQFAKFSSVGVVNTITSGAMYLWLSRPVGLDPHAAYALSFVVAVTISFVLNKRWTFRNRERRYRRQYGLFFGISAVGLGLSESVLFITHRLLGIHDLVAFCLAVLVGLAWNFNANRWWTFSAMTQLP